jgi:carboxyl-terminal processing protease
MLKTLFSLFLLVSLSAFAGHSDQLATFDKTVKLVNEHFYDRTFRGLDWPVLVEHHRSQITATTSDEQLERILSELLATLKTSHTEFVSSSDQEYWALKSIFSGRIDGAPTKQIGAWFTRLDGKWFIKNVFSGGPAAMAGLLPGDEILSVNGKPFSPVDSFSGNTLRILTIKRAQRQNPLQIRIRPVNESFQRSMLRASNESFKILNADKKRIAYFHLWSGTHNSFKNSLKVAATEAAKKSDVFVLDLRDGFGGASPEYLEPFFQRAYGSPAVYSKPLVILINDGVRSGKEWITYVLKEADRAILIGSRTKGYFLAGMPFEIRRGRFLLYLAVNEDPTMPKLEGNGIYPDIEIPFNLPYSEGRDPVLESALKYIRNR